MLHSPTAVKHLDTTSRDGGLANASAMTHVQPCWVYIPDVVRIECLQACGVFEHYRRTAHSSKQLV
jgi:hypothetical protein